MVYIYIYNHLCLYLRLDKYSIRNFISILLCDFKLCNFKFKFKLTLKNVELKGILHIRS